MHVLCIPGPSKRVALVPVRRCDSFHRHSAVVFRVLAVDSGGAQAPHQLDLVGASEHCCVHGSIHDRFHRSAFCLERATPLFYRVEHRWRGVRDLQHGRVRRRYVLPVRRMEEQQHAVNRAYTEGTRSDAQVPEEHPRQGLRHSRILAIPRFHDRRNASERARVVRNLVYLGNEKKEMKKENKRTVTWRDRRAEASPARPPFLDRVAVA